MIEGADLGRARRVFEFGFGTGRFAAQLFDHLPADARYVGQDVSATYARTRERAARALGRAP